MFNSPSTKQVKTTPLDKSVAGTDKRDSKEGLVVDPLARVTNRFDQLYRNKYFSQISFIRDYKVLSLKNISVLWVNISLINRLDMRQSTFKTSRRKNWMRWKGV